MAHTTGTISGKYTVSDEAWESIKEMRRKLKRKRKNWIHFNSSTRKKFAPPNGKSAEKILKSARNLIKKASGENNKPLHPEIIVLWHEPSNTLATCELKRSSLPLLSILDDEYKGVNPFYAYPMKYLLEYYGWRKIGEI